MSINTPTIHWYQHNLEFTTHDTDGMPVDHNIQVISNSPDSMQLLMDELHQLNLVEEDCHKFHVTREPATDKDVAEAETYLALHRAAAH